MKKSPYRPGIYDLIAPLVLVFIGIVWTFDIARRSIHYGKAKIKPIQDRL